MFVSLSVWLAFTSLESEVLPFSPVGAIVEAVDFSVVHGLFDDKEGEDEKCPGEGNLDVEIEAPRVAPC
jgi:hypothetical protein